MLTAALLLAASQALPGAPDVGAPDIQASRRAGPIEVDGLLDEPAWALARPFSRFVQNFPLEGEPPSERTEVRVLHDERTLFVGIRCYDRHPGEVVRPLGRRDSPPVSDQVAVLIDANLDRRSAVQLVLTAGGVQADALVYDDDRVTTEWDAVWKGAVAQLPDGWSAEMAVPISALRLSGTPRSTWGFAVQRELGRTRERMATAHFPRSGRGLASRLGLLGGIEGVRPGTDLEITPYLAGRLSLRPPAPDAEPARLRPRILDPAATAGADFRARLGPSLTLSGAVNPDFGQVEADQILLNLTGFETFFPEKRPLFTQGMELFLPVGTGADLRAPHQLFYSRRVGMDAPILAAAKLVGRPAERVEVGLLEALVMGTGQRPGTTEATADADRSLRWQPRQPLQLAPGTAYPVRPPLAQNHLAGVVRWEAADRLVLGAQATSAIPLEGPCDGDDARFDKVARPLSACHTRSGHAAALDVNATSGDGTWYALGQVSASLFEGPRRLVLPDGVVLRPGDGGLGAYLRGGKRGGEPWRFDVYAQWSSPRLELNASGFQETQNQALLRGRLLHTRAGGAGPFHEWTLFAGANGAWTTDGSALLRDGGGWAGAEALLREPYLFATCYWSFALPRRDPRGIAPLDRGGSVDAHALALPGWQGLSCGAATDAARPFSAEGNLYAARYFASSLGAPWFHGGAATVALRPHPRLQTSVGLTYEWNAFPIRHAGDEAHRLDPVLYPSPDERLLLGSLTAPTLSLVLRQLVVLTPRLTFQLYGQLFADHGRWNRLYVVRRPAAGQAVTYPAPEAEAARGDLVRRPAFHDGDLVLNAVLRWEIRPGAVLHAVYARRQARSLSDEAAGSLGLDPRGLAGGPTTDSLLVKLSWWVAP